jgi:O-acetyl-ADP-ribose deacetylase (regulator of RNase III)
MDARTDRPRGHDEPRDGLRAPWLGRIELRTCIPSHAAIFRDALGDDPAVAIVDGPLLDGCAADAAFVPTNGFGYLDAGIDGAFARRFGRRLQRNLQERIGQEFDGELPCGAAMIIPTGDLSLPLVVAAPATQYPGSISGDPMIYQATLAALRTVDAWNAADEGPWIASLMVPDPTRPPDAWQAERVALQVAEAIRAWRRDRDARALRAA